MKDGQTVTPGEKNFALFQSPERDELIQKILEDFGTQHENRIHTDQRNFTSEVDVRILKRAVEVFEEMGHRVRVHTRPYWISVEF